MGSPEMAKPDAERFAAELAAHPDFRVLRRLDVTQDWPALTGAGVEIETFDARTRYSRRDGQKERVRV
jgi:hypothetical protein